jgi:hypothetical protein
MSIVESFPATSATSATAGRTPLADTVTSALAEPEQDRLAALVGARPHNRRDRFAALLALYELHTAALETLGDRACHQHHPALATIKSRCEADWLAELDALPLPDGVDPDDAPAAMRALAARDRLPAVYKWVAKDASWSDIVTFLALEGGPDAGFDDLVATCQVGLSGPAKMELARNYWDEMGDGDPDAVHTTLHDRLVAAIEMPTLPRAGLPTSALARTAMGGLLATNRWLQPEMLGALGLIELQAGPRCRLVLQGFDRCSAPAGAYPFYDVHAEVDPRHGKDWLDNAVVPTVAAHPEWSPRIVRGAHWRSVVNREFLTDIDRLLRHP